MSSFKLSRWAGLAFGIAGVCGFVVPSVAFADQEARFESMDTDGDGRISPDEHAAAASRMFEKMDTDHDGYLTRAEVKAGHEKYMHRKAASSGAVRPAD